MRSWTSAQLQLSELTTYTKAFLRTLSLVLRIGLQMEFYSIMLAVDSLSSSSSGRERTSKNARVSISLSSIQSGICIDTPFSEYTLWELQYNRGFSLEGILKLKGRVRDLCRVSESLILVAICKVDRFQRTATRRAETPMPVESPSPFSPHVSTWAFFKSSFFETSAWWRLASFRLSQQDKG